MRPDRLFLLVLGLTAAASRADACGLVVASAPEPVVLLHEPFDPSPPVGRIVVALRNEGEGERFEFRLQQGAQQGGQAGANVTFEAVRNGTDITQVDRGVFQVDIPRLSERSVEINADVDFADVAEPGTSENTLRLDVRDLTSGTICIQETLIPIRVTVPSRAQINIAGASGAFEDGPDFYRIDFGDLTTGAERNVFVQLRANGDAVMSITSQNGGRLLHSELPTAGVAYTAVLQGRTLDLANQTVVNVPPARSLAGVSVPMSFRIGDVSGAPAGRYSDLVTLVVSAL